MADIPTNEPAAAVAGDTWKWRREDLGNFPASSWTLTYYFVQQAASPATFSVEAAADGDAFAVTVAAATTAAYTAGLYTWEAYVAKDDERYRVDGGTFEVRPNLATSEADPRSYWVRVRDAARAVLEGRASKDQMSYTINGRSLSRMEVSELLALLDRAEREAKKAEAAERIANGLGAGNLVMTRFGRG